MAENQRTVQKRQERSSAAVRSHCRVPCNATLHAFTEGFSHHKYWFCFKFVKLDRVLATLDLTGLDDVCSLNGPLATYPLKYWTALMAIAPACFSEKDWVSQACFVSGLRAVIGSAEGLFSEAVRWLYVLTFLSSVLRPSSPVSVGIWKLLYLWLWCYLVYSKEWKGFLSLCIWTVLCMRVYLSASLDLVQI